MMKQRQDLNHIARVRLSAAQLLGPHMLHSFIHSFIHIEHLYSASSRKLLRSAPNTSTVLGAVYGSLHYMVIFVVIYVMWSSMWCGHMCYIVIYVTWSSYVMCLSVCGSSVKGNQLFPFRSDLNIHDVCIFTFLHAYSLGMHIQVSIWALTHSLCTCIMHIHAKWEWLEDVKKWCNDEIYILRRKSQDRDAGKW